MSDRDWKQYWLDNKEVRQATNRSQYEKNREKRLAYAREYRKKNKEKCEASVSAWIQENMEKYRARHAEYRRQKSADDPYYRLRKNVARRMTLAMKAKSATTNELIGCTPEFLRFWLESKFKDGMSWDNYGPVWHVDHIKPMALFDLTDAAQQRAACNYTNLQPLFAKENIAKGKRYPEECHVRE